MLAWCRGLFTAYDWQKAGGADDLWRRADFGNYCYSLAGTKAVILGYGNIGRTTGKKLKALGAPQSGSTNTNAVITGSVAYDKAKMKKAVASKAWRQYYLAYPASYGYVMSAAKDANNIDCTVREAANVTFTFNGIDVEYKVYYIHNGSDYGTTTITWTM
jgi:hypothetical protein